MIARVYVHSVVLDFFFHVEEFVGSGENVVVSVEHKTSYHFL